MKKMKFICQYLMYTLSLIILVGYFTLNYGVSSNLKIFLVALFLMSFLSYLQTKYKVKKILLIAPLLVYFLLTLYSWGIFWNPILPSFILSLVVFLTNKYYSLFLISFAAIISFHLYPSEMVSSKEIDIANHQISSYLFSDSINLVLKDEECLIIETWGKKCRQCFLAMEALEPFFLDLEKKYKFQHEYLYIGELTNKEKELFRKKEYIKFSRNLFQDKNSVYYTETMMQGYPYFNFYKTDKSYLKSLIGFQHIFTENYKNYIKSYVNCHCDSR
jgi:hypothetical protein